MNIQIQAQSQFFSVPVSDQGESMNLIIRHKQEFMQLSIIPADPDRALFTAHYRLPFPAEGTVLDADPRLLEYLIWQNHQPEKSLILLTVIPVFTFLRIKDGSTIPTGCIGKTASGTSSFSTTP